MGTGGRLPSKSFSPHSYDQSGFGPLIHDFTLPFDKEGKLGGEVTGRRMVIPYQIWMLQRLEGTLQCLDAASARAFLEQFDGASDLTSLPALLARCRVNKVGGTIFPADDHSKTGRPVAGRLLMLVAI